MTEDQAAGLFAKTVGIGILGIIGLVAFFNCFTTIDPGTRGVSVILGHMSQEAVGEGLTLKFPFIQSIKPYTIKQSSAHTVAPCFSSDIQTVTADINVLYHIPEGKIVTLARTYQGEIFNGLVNPRVQEGLKSVSAKYTAQEIVKNRELIRAEALVLMRQRLNGLVLIDDLAINNLTLSKELHEAIEKKQIKQQEAEAKKYELEQAQIKAKITEVDAIAEANAVKIKGEALRNNPKAIDLEIAKKWDGVSPRTVVINGKPGGGANVVLPIGE